jgi:hypothetical protein
MNQLETYQQQREVFKKRKAELVSKIKGLEKEIATVVKTINNERPKTERGEEVCDSCDIISLFPKQGFYFECEVCGRKQEVREGYGTDDPIIRKIIDLHVVLGPSSKPTPRQTIYASVFTSDEKIDAAIVKYASVLKRHGVVIAD